MSRFLEIVLIVALVMYILQSIADSREFLHNYSESNRLCELALAEYEVRQ